MIRYFLETVQEMKNVAVIFIIKSSGDTNLRNVQPQKNLLFTPLYAIVYLLFFKLIVNFSQRKKNYN